MHLLCHLATGRLPHTTHRTEPGARTHRSRVHTRRACPAGPTLHLQHRQVQDAGRWEPAFTSPRSPQIKTHREHREEPGNLLDLIISVPQAPCGTQDAPLPSGWPSAYEGGRGRRKKPSSTSQGRRAQSESDTRGPCSAFHPELCWAPAASSSRASCG